MVDIVFACSEAFMVVKCQDIYFETCDSIGTRRDDVKIPHVFAISNKSELELKNNKSELIFILS